MKVKAIICELNPFHQGHQYLIDQAIKGEDRNRTCLVAAMSGPFVQRGTPAILDKWTRARIAIDQGFDLVLEIPAAYVLQSARFFAYGSLKSLSLLKKLDCLVFGVEDIFFEEDFQKRLADLNQPGIQESIQDKVKAGLPYRQAVSQSLGMDLGPNTILAMEYMAMADELHLNVHFQAISRRGSNYHNESLDSPTPSASAIRRGLIQGKLIKDDLLGHELIDQADFRESLDPLKAYLDLRAILNPMDFTASPLFETGMDFRLKESLEKTESVDQAILEAANKRQSASRYRRMLVTSLLGMETGKLPDITFLRPLAFNERGRGLLKDLDCPVVQKVASADLDPESQALLEISLRAQALQEYLLGLPAKMDYRQTYFIPS